LSAKKVLDSGMLYRKEDVPMGLPVMDEYSVFMTDSNIVAEAKKALVEYMTVTR
jgi:copper homeostasis protein